ncbi:MAG: DNA primase, partial [Actinobacteria bacterium]|nr:DNA primase [Actinomycetota bacterium]
MAGKISPRDIEEVKARVNIADVVGSYVALKPASAGSLKGLCPFHQEKSPSFNVRPLQGFYHCFGCGAGGDVYKFLQEMESLSFYEAVENLAGKVGYTLTYEAGAKGPDQGQKARIYEANAAAAKYFQDQLMTDSAIPGRDFLKSRGFDKAAAEMFGVGFAPKGWNNLTDHLKAIGFTEEELITASLSSKGERGLYDKFRGRLIWPIRDTSNQVLGFGARKLFDDDQGPKYLNTSETPVYHKSAVLYGIDLAKKEISKSQKVVVVEGYTDVMACHLAGITTAVATCGTAFGDEHIRILNRMLSANVDNPAEVIFTFDPDEAGQKAAMRAFADADKFHANSFIAVGPDGLDPSDLRVQKGDEAVALMIENKKPIYEFAIKQKMKNFSLDSVEGRVGAARASASVIATIRDSALRSVYIRELANWVNLDLSEVSALVDRAIKEKVVSAVAPLRQDSLPQDQVETAFQAPDLKDPAVRFERQLLEVLVQQPAMVAAEDLKQLSSGDFLAGAHGAVAKAIYSALEYRTDNNWLPKIAEGLEPTLQSALRSLAATELPARNDQELERYVSGVVNAGFIALLTRQKLSMQAVLRQLDPSESAKIEQLQRELISVEER